MNKTRIIFVGNYKGGVGKTTSVLNFAEKFTERGNKVLVMDIDPQSSLSEILINNNQNELSSFSKSYPEKTLNYVFDLNITKIKKYNNLVLKFDQNIIQHYNKEKYDFIVSSLFYRDGLGLDELSLRMEDNIEYLSILKNFLDTILSMVKYDYVLIDCPPTNNLITKSAFLLSDYYIIPTILDGISTNGVAHYINTVTKTYNKYCIESEDAVIAKHFFGNKPQLIGIFTTFIRKQVNYDTEREIFINTLKQHCNDENIYFFKEEINNYIDIARSTVMGTASVARPDYSELSDRILQRINQI